MNQTSSIVTWGLGQAVLTGPSDTPGDASPWRALISGRGGAVCAAVHTKLGLPIEKYQ